MDKNTALIIEDKDFVELFKTLTNNYHIKKAEMTDDYLISIGKVVVKFQLLEFNIKQCIFRLLRIKQPFGNIITNDHSFRNLLSLLSNLHKETMKDSSNINILIGQAEKAEVERNKIVHSFWVGGYNEDAIRFKYTNNNGKGNKVIEESYKIEDINMIAEWIDKIETAFEGLMNIENR